MSKYGNIREEYNGDVYMSKAEARYAKFLDLSKKATHSKQRVASWERQVPYAIEINGIKICKYLADFRVVYCDGTVEVVDVKGYQTDIYRLKKKLVKAVHGVDIIEVKC